MNDHPLYRGLARVIDTVTLASGWWLLLIAVATCVEMVTRKLFNFSLQGVDEVGGYTLAVTSALGFSFTLLARGHTRVDFLLSRLPANLRAFFNTLAMVSLAAVAVFATFRAWSVLSESIEFQSHSTSPLQTPMWIPQSLWLFGYLLFALVASCMAGHACVLLARDREQLNKVYGPPTLEEEIEAETGGIRVGDVIGESAKPGATT
jgi:TRAP-type mannitol/chloroaromatic compound transport system permease small subunit